MICVTGVSGSGKTSLALDTLYAEGQRRYIESFSAYTRQFLQRLEKPEADRIEGIPPAVAVTHKNQSKSSRSTVGTATETIDYLRLLYAKIGEVVCHGCQRPVTRDSSESAAEMLSGLRESTRFMISFPISVSGEEEAKETATQLREDGFVRAIANGKSVQIHDDSWESANGAPTAQDIFVVVDRLVAGSATNQRIRESLETAFDKGGGRAVVFARLDPQSTETDSSGHDCVTLDDTVWRRIRFSSRLCCDDCAIEFPAQEPRLFSFNSPMGACPECEGFGNIIDIDMERVVPDASKSIRDGAIAPWNTPAYSHELDELLELADDYNVPVDVPFSQLSSKHVDLLRDGVPERSFGGFKGFFAWLERHKYKMHIRVLLSKYRAYDRCPDCLGARLQPEALQFRLGTLEDAERVLSAGRRFCPPGTTLEATTFAALPSPF